MEKEKANVEKELPKAEKHVKKMKKFFNEFAKFALRGNVLDLAVGVIIGGAMQSVIRSFTENLITPIVTTLISSENFKELSFTVFGAELKYGNLLNDIINFIILAFAVFLIIKAMNKLAEISHIDIKKEDTKKCRFCCTDIPKKAVRCPNCTAELNK